MGLLDTSSFRLSLGAKFYLLMKKVFLGKQKYLCAMPSEYYLEECSETPVSFEFSEEYLLLFDKEKDLEMIPKVVSVFGINLFSIFLSYASCQALSGKSISLRFIRFRSSIKSFLVVS